MNTYLVVSDSNYGDISCVVNAENREDVDKVVKGNEYVWEGYRVELIDTTSRGVVAGYGKKWWEDHNE